MRPVDSGEGSDGSGNSPPHKTPHLSVSAMLGLSFEYTNYFCSHWWGRRLSPLCLPQVLDLTIEYTISSIPCDALARADTTTVKVGTEVSC